MKTMIMKRSMKGNNTQKIKCENQKYMCSQLFTCVKDLFLELFRNSGFHHEELWLAWKASSYTK
jgi:hypothetical protein